MHFSTVKITEGVLKVGSSLGIEEAKNASLKNLGRLSNSTPLFLKGIFRILQDFLCTDFFFFAFVTLILWCLELKETIGVRVICQVFIKKI